MFPSRLTLAALIVASTFLATHGTAQEQQTAPTVLNIAPAQPALQIRGEIAGYQTMTYVFDSAAGVETTIGLDHPGRASLYHNVIAPSGAMLFNGSLDGARFRATLGERGRYQVRVYLMRNDARRGMRVAYTLRIAQSSRPAQRPLPAQATGPSFDCRKARPPIETAVCRSPALSELDARLDFVYRDAIDGAPPGRASQIRSEQRRWITEREACARERRLEQCLTARYATRIGQLEPKR